MRDSIVKQIAEPSFKKAIDATKESLDKLLRRDRHPVVHVLGDDVAQDRVARELPSDGKIRPLGPEEHGKYPTYDRDGVGL